MLFRDFFYLYFFSFDSKVFHSFCCCTEDPLVDLTFLEKSRWYIHAEKQQRGIGMLGGKHYQKKIDKKAAKKEAKKATNVKQTGAAAFTARGSSQIPASASIGGGLGNANPKRKNNGSTLKGPVVSYHDLGAERGQRDVANDRKGTPFSNAKEEREYLGKSRGGLSKRAPSSASSSPPPRQSFASSAAQRRRVLRQKGDDDLLSHFREQLNASTFRLLNEQLYHSPNSFAAQLLRDKGTFADYHVGYRQQLVQWPINPNEFVASALLHDKRGRFPAVKNAGKAAESSSIDNNNNNTNNSNKAPSGIPLNWVVADMGCGDAQIAAKLSPLGYTVHSFDFCALNPRVTEADTTAVPLGDGSVDVCVFSLSLMATDYQRSLFEAFRILKPHRLLKIVEVRSRIPFPNRFAEMVCSIGFSLEHSDVAGDYFVAFDFTKKEGVAAPNTTSLAHPPEEVLLPSVYKKR